jgi:hypothetical protein
MTLKFPIVAIVLSVLYPPESYFYLLTNRVLLHFSAYWHQEFLCFIRKHHIALLIPALSAGPSFLAIKALEDPIQRLSRSGVRSGAHAHHPRSTFSAIEVGNMKAILLGMAKPIPS